MLSRGADAFRMAATGAAFGLPAFGLVILSATFQSVPMFTAGAFLVGFGGGLFGHGTLTATMNSAPRAQAGLALGAWGAVQATGAGVAVALGGALSDAVSALAVRGHLGASLSSPDTGYLTVYVLEMAMLACTVWLMSALQRRAAPGPVAPCPTPR